MNSPAGSFKQFFKNMRCNPCLPQRSIHRLASVETGMAEFVEFSKITEEEQPFVKHLAPGELRLPQGSVFTRIAFIKIGFIPVGKIGVFVVRENQVVFYDDMPATDATGGGSPAL